MIINEDSFRFLAFMAKFDNYFLHILLLLFYHHRYPHIILCKRLYIKIAVCKHLYSIVVKLYIMQNKNCITHICWVIFIVKCFGNAISIIFLHSEVCVTSLSVREMIFRYLKYRGAFPTLPDTHFFLFWWRLI